LLKIQHFEIETKNFFQNKMELDEDEIINLREFLDKRLALVRDDYFDRNKNTDDLVKKDMIKEEFTGNAYETLKEMCK
jgi:hypothetical protein